MNRVTLVGEDVKAAAEAQGIKAIIALQKTAGIIETEEEARTNWRKMDDYQKKSTLAAFMVVCGSKS
jgi:hypothetical protein